ncbi:MAG: hypothetical protein C0176_01545 [Mesoaciditoga sp.]|uniref:hypothetical protein n=1 Tax=Athalassotoga sp. TaxID=2022597 RepID=UPI000CB81D0B|nr:MAG: hypothetical protein C0185_00105 [Mesoaciditoga sp.]PMP80582.1 MAG: hypothetical protein C0176_01545 [Mesoaciditoga sp.]HEU24258.1 hypothetical protein [Mesoaciditoga lauensis]
MNVNYAFFERIDGPYSAFKDKLIQFGVKIYTIDDFKNIFDLNIEIKKSGGSDFQGIDLVVLELNTANQRLEENYILNSIEEWKISAIYSCVKNYRNSVIVLDPDDFDKIIESLEECGDITLQDRRMLSLKALYRVLRYTSLIHKEMSELFASEKFETLILEEKTPLRYGENPQQLAYLSKIAKTKAFFDILDEDTLFTLSYNNIIDIYTALSLLRYLDYRFAVRVHHGVIAEVKRSNFNFKDSRGVLAANFLSKELLKGLDGNDLDIVILPDFPDYPDLKIKKFIKIKEIPNLEIEKEYRFLEGNFLVQTPDDLLNMRFLSDEFDVQYKFVNLIVALSKSMACCIFKDYEMISLGSGQAEQIEALEVALMKAKKYPSSLDGAICAFDGPIRDLKIPDLIIGSGIKTVIEPGGVKEDKNIRKKLEENGIELVFSGRRRYKI